MTPIFSKTQGRLWARWALDPNLGPIHGILLEWRGGKFLSVSSSPRPPADLDPKLIFDNHLVTPGLLNAHCHLDYSFLRGKLPRGAGFAPWLRAMIHARQALNPAETNQEKRMTGEALESALREGATAIWDIDSLGWGRHALGQNQDSGQSFEEFLVPRMKGWRARWAEWRTKHSVGNGISPHTTFTVVPRALSDLSRFAHKARLPMAIHLAESPEERELLLAGRGPLRDLFIEQFDYDPAPVLGKGRSPIVRAERAGLLGPRTLAIHCNLPEPGEIEKLATSRAVVVFCPCSHEFFGYPDYPLSAMRKAGVRLALGTDSLASNDQLSMRAEVHSLIRRDAGKTIPPLELLAIMTGASLRSEPPYGGRGLLQVDNPAEWSLWCLRQEPQIANADALFSEFLTDRTVLFASSAFQPLPPELSSA